MEYKSGFVTVIGRPNVGKSTLINTLIGEKVNIVTSKPQTTRNKIRAVYSVDEGQIVFVDTPGFHKARNELDKYMLARIYESLKEVDVVLFMVDGTSSCGRGDKYIQQQIKTLATPVIGVLNKIDCLQRSLLIKRKKEYERELGFEVIPISAGTGENLATLIDEIFSRLPAGPRYYPEDMYTDQIEQFMIAELVREKIFKLTRQEIPYGTAVLVEEIKEREKGKLFIRANIYVEKKSHKGIIIGKKGKMLREIGRKAREEIEKLLGTGVYLDLWVKVQPDWRDDKNLLKRLGYKG